MRKITEQVFGILYSGWDAGARGIFSDKRGAGDSCPSFITRFFKTGIQLEGLEAAAGVSCWAGFSPQGVVNLTAVPSPAWLAMLTSPP
jgi:hypothetical protein